MKKACSGTKCACRRAAEAREKMLELSQRAQAAARDGELEKALALVQEFLAIEGADRKWGLAFRGFLLSQLEEKENDAGKKEALGSQRRGLEDELLAGDEKGEAWLHRWERARLYNNRAWAAYEKARNKTELQAALHDSEESLRFWPYFLPHQDTRFRILMKLGRTDDAYRIVRWVDLIQPGWHDFDDVRRDAAYRNWLRKHKSERVELPAGPASAGEVVCPVKEGPRSAAGDPLYAAERAALENSRFGRDEWHRARNSALLAMLLDGQLSAKQLLELSPQKLDLSRGVLMVEGVEKDIPPRTLEKLRHWLLYGSTNHPRATDPAAPAGMRTRLFVGWDLQPMTEEEVDKLLAYAGRQTGVRQLTLERIRETCNLTVISPESVGNSPAM